MSILSTMIYKVPNHNDLPTWKRMSIVAINGILPILIPVFFRYINPVLGIGGALGGCLACFTFPALMYNKVSSEKLYHWRNICALLFAIYGIIACGISTYTSVMSVVKQYKK